jgi:hypothetical protein
MNAALLCLCLTVGPMETAPSPTPVKPLTLEEFCASFKPVPGTYEVLFLHPVSKKPVTVTFTLPPGCLKVRCEKREIEFDYGDREIRLRFRLFGKVAVISD